MLTRHTPCAFSEVSFTSPPGGEALSAFERRLSSSCRIHRGSKAADGSPRWLYVNRQPWCSASTAASCAKALDEPPDVVHGDLEPDRPRVGAAR